METKSFEALHRSLAGNAVKAVSALRQTRASMCGSADERIAMLFDEGTFVETGAYVTRRNSEFEDNAAEELEGVVTGWGSVNGELVYAYSQDLSRTKGAVSETQAQKIAELYRLAVENGAPIVGIFDSAGAYLPEGIRALAAYGKIMKAASLASGVIPQIAVIPGIAQGAAAVVAGMYDFVIITEETGSLSVNPPFVVGEEAGKSAFAAETGLAAIKAKDAAEAIGYAKLLLSLIPANNAEGTVDSFSADEINRLVSTEPYDKSRDMKDLVAAAADEGKVLTLWDDYAPEALCGLISLGGVVCGVAGNNYANNDGILTAAAARKLTKLISFCDCYNIPVITFVDSKGADVSLEAEKSPYAAELAKLAHTYAMARTPLVTLNVGEAYGSVFTLMGSKALGADVVLSLENAKIGVMPASSAVAFLWNDKITGEVTREALEEEWNNVVGTPIAAARAGEVDDIIESAELRQRLCAAVMMLQAKSSSAPFRRHVNMPL